MLVTSIVVVGLQITTGYAGRINLGQAAFMGVGAYAASVIEVKAGLPFWVLGAVGGLVAALAGWLFGLTAARIKGTPCADHHRGPVHLPLHGVESAIGLARRRPVVPVCNRLSWAPSCSTPTARCTCFWSSPW